MANFASILLAKKWNGDVQIYSFSEMYILNLHIKLKWIASLEWWKYKLLIETLLNPYTVEIWYFSEMDCFVDKLTTFCFKKGPERKPYKNKYQLIDVTHEINKEAA